MNTLELSDRLALDMLNRDAILDAIKEWCTTQHDQNSLPKILWSALDRFAANKYISQSQIHISEMTADFKKNHNRPLIAALQHLVRRHFVWHGRAMLRYETVLQTQFWLAKCNPVQQQCYLWAIDAPSSEHESRLRRLPKELLSEFFRNAPLLPEVDEWNLHGLRHLGLAEIHRHLNGSALPNFLWNYLLTAPHRVKIGTLAGEVDKLENKQIASLLYTAADLRDALLVRLFRTQNHSYDTMQNSHVRTPNSDWYQAWSFHIKNIIKSIYQPINCRPIKNSQFFISSLSKFRDPASYLPQASDYPLSAERALLVHAFEHIHTHPHEVTFLAALHAYIIIQNLIWRALTKPRDYAKGFDRFALYHGLFLRDTEKARGRFERERYLDRLFQAQITGGVRWAELRVAPTQPEKGGPLRDVLNLEKSLQKMNIRTLFRPTNSPQSADFGVQKLPMTGLIFHFIKRRDNAIKNITQSTCRHSKLRRDIRRQALAIQRLRLTQRFGKHIIGIDAAGPEIEAGPEVFAPVIKWLRDQPTKTQEPKWILANLRQTENFSKPLGLTFHAGEDFRHILSGLRSIDETIHFLGMHSGDRIGHGLALGLDYKSWCHRVEGLVVMPRGQRLDDLVWMRTKLAAAASTFAGCLFEIDQEIEQLAREIFFSDHRYSIKTPSLQVMFEAWKMRGFDPLYIHKRELPSGWTVRDSPKLIKDAFKLFYDYHFDAGQRRRYNETVRIPLTTSIEEWHSMITWLQDQMLRKLARKRIAIEINPTSNLCIGSLSCMTEHPVFRWHPPEPSDTAIRPYILVGSDDPGVFGTELLFEYAALSKAAEERGASPRDISAWLSELRETSRKFCFLDTRD